MAKKTTSKAKAKAKDKTQTKAEKPSTKIEAKAKIKKVKATTKDMPLTDEFLKAQAHHGNREGVIRMVDKVLERETENTEPVDLLARIGKAFQKKHGKGPDGKFKFRYSTANNVRGLIFRYRHTDMPKREVRLITYDNELYSGKIGLGRPVFNGSLTKTGGVALKDQKLAGLIPQKNKPDKYWWFDASKKNEAAIVSFMEKVGF
jgi:hypothetical protein